jgi:hypothetical protein
MSNEILGIPLGLLNTITVVWKYLFVAKVDPLLSTGDSVIATEIILAVTTIFWFYPK